MLFLANVLNQRNVFAAVLLSQTTEKYYVSSAKLFNLKVEKWFRLNLFFLEAGNYFNIQVYRVRISNSQFTICEVFWQFVNEFLHFFFY